MRLRFAWILALTALVVLGGCRSDEEALGAHFQRAEEYRETEQFDEAIIEYKNALQIDPNHAGSHYGLALSFLETSKIKEGFWELRETVRLDPSNHDAAIRFSQISIYAGELEEALKRADAILAEDPDNDKAWLVKGQAHEGLKQPGEALEAYRKATEVAPESEAALLVYANYHRRNGDRNAAEPLFEHAAEKLPTAQTLLALASFYSEDRERNDRAEAAYRKALELSPPDEKARGYMLLGNFLFSRDRQDDAVALLEQGIQEAEDPLDLYYQLARFERRRGNEERADELFELATQAVEDDPRPFLVLSSYRARGGDLDGALAAAERAVEVAPDLVDAKLRKAEVLLEIGFRDDDATKVGEGRMVVDSVLADEPSHPGGQFVKAKLDMAENDTESAIQSLRSAIDVRPDWAEAHFLLGTALSMAGQRSAARTELARALEIDASLTEARRVLADVHASLGENEYAVEEGLRYLAERPDAHPMRVRVAQSLVHVGRIDEAMKQIEAIPEEERDETVHYALGRIHLARGNDAKAHELLLKALEARPTHADILRSLLQIEERMGRREQGLARIQSAIEENPDDVKLQQLGGLVALAQGRIDEAVAAFNRAIEIAPEDMDSYKHLADLYVRTGRTAQTIETYQKALERKPDQPRIHHFLGVLFEYGGQTEQAMQHYEEAIRYAPDLAEAKNNLAYLYAEQKKNLDRALDLAQDAKALMPDDPNTADTLGWVLYQRGVPSAAIGYLKEAEAGMPAEDANLGLIRHHLALAYEASGDKENARVTIERAISAHQEFAEAQRARGVPVGDDPPWFQEARSLRERL